MTGTIKRRLEAAGLEIHGLELFRNGQREHFGSEGRFPVYSVTKSVTSAAFSLACDDGLLSADTPLADFLEDRYRAKMSACFKALPFWRFLTMRAGKLPFRPEGEDWTESCLRLFEDTGDCGYHYSNIPAYLVGAAVENAVGGDLAGYLQKRLFEPLGIAAPPFAKSPEGHFYGATGMELSAHELCLSGQLYLQGGCWEGVQLISRTSVESAVTPYVDTGCGDSYGYFFRGADDHFSMVGKWGQRVIVFPKRGAVIAYLSHQPERYNELYKVILGAVREFDTN